MKRFFGTLALCCASLANSAQAATVFDRSAPSRLALSSGFSVLDTSEDSRVVQTTQNRLGLLRGLSSVLNASELSRATLSRVELNYQIRHTISNRLVGDFGLLGSDGAMLSDYVDTVSVLGQSVTYSNALNTTCSDSAFSVGTSCRATETNTILRTGTFVFTSASDLAAFRAGTARVTSDSTLRTILADGDSARGMSSFAFEVQSLLFSGRLETIAPPPPPPPPAVPLPASLPLLGAGLFGFALMRRHRAIRS